MENNNTSGEPAPPPAPIPTATTTDNGSVSQDSFLTEESSKDVPSANANNGDENLSPISDSELDEDEGATNDTTDARPVSPVREEEEGEAISQSNDNEKEQVVNDNEGTNVSSPADDDTNTGDVEMLDAESSVAPEETQDEPKDADQENNNPGPAEESATGQSLQDQEEPMDVDETDKARKKANNETSQTHLEDDSVTNQSASDIGVSNTQDPHFHSMDDSIDQNNDQPENETDMLPTAEAQNQQDPPAEETAREEPLPPQTEEEDADINVQEIEIGTFKDVVVVTEEILTRTAFDKILEDTQKNISEPN